jgi:hypothetical protein
VQRPCFVSKLVEEKLLLAATRLLLWSCVASTSTLPELGSRPSMMLATPKPRRRRVPVSLLALGHSFTTSIRYSSIYSTKPSTLEVTDGCVEFAQLRSGCGTYFDSVGHETWRGFHALNSPARSCRRASRSSATIRGFCAVNQSCSSSTVSTEEITDTGISTVSLAFSQHIGLHLKSKL